MPQEYEIYYVGPGDKTNITIKQYIKAKKVINTLWPELYGDNHLVMVRLPQRSPSQSLAKYRQLNQNNQKTTNTNSN